MIGQQKLTNFKQGNSIIGQLTYHSIDDLISKFFHSFHFRFIVFHLLFYSYHILSLKKKFLSISKPTDGLETIGLSETSPLLSR